jgi:hypothetical protein
MTTLADLAPELCQVCPHSGVPERVSRCRPWGHVEATGAKDRTKCTHKLTATEAAQRGQAPGASCGAPANVSRYPAAGTMPGAAAAGRVTRAAGGMADPVLIRAWGQVPEWSDDESAILWRPDDDAGTCPECDGAMVAEPGRTMVHCPLCGWCDDYPEVIQWRERQHAGGGIATRGSASLAGKLASQREHDVECGRLERQITGILRADKRLTSDCREMLTSYLRQVQSARTAKDGPEILATLLEQYQAEPIKRRGWLSSFDDIGGYLSWLATRGGYELGEDQGDGEDSEVVQAEIVGDDGLTDSERNRAALPPRPTWSPPPKCRRCADGGVVGLHGEPIKADLIAENSQGEIDLCDRCYVALRSLMYFHGTIELIERYPPPHRAAELNGSTR